MYYPNKMGRIYLAALEEALSRNGLNALLNWAEMSHYINERPPDNWERAFDFADVAKLDDGLTQLYGPKGGNRLALRSGRYFFARGIKKMGIVAGLGDIALRTLPINTKLKMGLNALARLFTQFSDQQSRAEEIGNQILFHVDYCPVCWQRQANKPICFFTVGVLKEALFWLSGGLSFRVVQSQCQAMGHEHCVFIIDKEPIK